MGLRLHSGRRDIALAALVSIFALGEKSARAQQDLPPPPPPSAPPVGVAPPPAPVVAPAPVVVVPVVVAPSTAVTSPATPLPAAGSGKPGEVVVVEGPSPLPGEPGPAETEAPLAGYHNGNFYLRSKDDQFRLYPQGRIHADSINYFGAGVPSLGPADALKSSLQLRRVRIEFAGELFKYWQFLGGVDFAPTAIDNPGANTATRASAVDAQSNQTFSDRQAAVEAPAVRPIPVDAFINFSPSPWANIQAGQFYVGFGFENRLSDNTLPFLERSITTRNVGTPFTRDIGISLWGEAPDKLIHYAIGVYNGDGQNRLNADNRYDFTARVLVKPFAPSKGPLQDASIGVSGKYGSKDSRYLGYDVSALSTGGGYQFWRPTYRDSFNRLVHILPSGDQGAFGADIFVPYSIVDVTGEVVYATTNTREALDGYQLSPFTERLGALKGVSYYVQASVWLIGTRDIIGLPGYGKPLKVDLTKPQKKAEHGLQVLARFEQTKLKYDGASRGGAADSKTPNGDINADVFQLGVNYWATKHVRVTLNYSLYSFPDSAPVSATATGGPAQGSGQRALAPAQLLAKGVDDAARDSGHSLHELQARIGIQF